MALGPVSRAFLLLLSRPLLPRLTHSLLHFAVPHVYACQVRPGDTDHCLKIIIALRSAWGLSPKHRRVFQKSLQGRFSKAFDQ